MPSNTKENGFETLIVDTLVNSNGYEQGITTEYNKQYAIDEDRLFRFLMSTQKKAMDELHILDSDLEKDRFFKQLDKKLKSDGVIELLRKGLRYKHLRLDLFYVRPSVHNPEAAALYEKNIFSVTRQLQYSSFNPRLALDVCAFINGLPVITMELKNQLTKQNVFDAVEQYCPTVHWMKMGRNAPAKTPDNPYDWAPRTITGILEKMEYLGHMVNFKTRKQSYRSKKKLENPQDQWKIFENTHEAIIDEETFARVQELRKNKRRPARTGKTNMFSGLVRCADCGEKLYYCTSNSFETRQDHFVCSTSRKKGKEVCDTHFIRAVVLEEGTLQHMRLVIQCVADYEDAFRRALGAKRSEEAKKDLSAKKRTLQKSENRLAELDRLFKRIYEDMVNGKLSETRFQMLADDYEQEQADLRAKIEMLENEIQNQEDQAENVDRFIRQAKKYLYLEKLTPTILNDMVNAVYVHAPDKSSGHRVQDVTISYNYIGILPANLLYDVMNGKAA